MLSLIMMLGLQAAVPVAEPGCRAMDNQVVHDFVRGIRAHPSTPDGTDRGSFIHVANLLNYWGSLCKWDRANADKFVVVQLASLLDIPTNRFNVARILAEIGPNLRHASGAIKVALNDEREMDRLSRERCERAGHFYCFLGGNTNEGALECVLQKAQTGVRNPDLCLWVELGGRND